MCEKALGAKNVVSSGPLTTVGELRAMTEVYAGRCGFLVRDDDAAALTALQDSLLATAAEWDALVFTVVEGSSSHRNLESMAARHGLHSLVAGTTPSDPWTAAERAASKELMARVQAQLETRRRAATTRATRALIVF